MVSGLPGSGKDTLLARNFPDLPVISMDDIRDEMGISATDNQGKVHQESYNRIKAFLRRGEDFAVNTTALTRVMRQKLTGTVLDYDGHLTAYSIDVPLDVARARNKGRTDPVPDEVIVKLGSKREPILSTEVHVLFSVDAGMGIRQVFGSEGPRRPELLPTP
jgi:predicted kinase